MVRAPELAAGKLLPQISVSARLNRIVVRSLMTVPARSQTKRERKVSHVFGFLLVGAFAAAMLWYPVTYGYVPRWLESRVDWQSTSGTILSAEVQESVVKATSYGFHVLVTYEYSWDNRTLRSERVGFAPYLVAPTSGRAHEILQDLKAQNPLTVHVRSSNPETSVLLKDSAGTAPLAPCLFFTVFGVGMSGIALFILGRMIVGR